MSKKYDVKRLRADLKKSIGSEGLNKKHINMNDAQLISDYGYIYGEEALNEYLLPEATRELPLFQIVIESVRVDLGNDFFVDVPDANERIFIEGNKGLRSLASDLMTFIKERNGQVVEADGDRFTFDTSDLTIHAKWVKESGELTKKELSDIEKISEELIKGTPWKI